MHLPYGITNIEFSPENYNLGLTAYGDALVIPKTVPTIRRGAEVGAFDASGQYIRESGLERHWGQVTRPPQIDPETAVTEFDGAAIFGGYVVNHFGHFTLETIARLWAIKRSDLPIVWASGTQLIPFQRDILARLGIAPKRHMFLTGPTAFSRLWVPTPGYIIGHWFHEEHQAALTLPPSPRGNGRIYLSRSSFRSKLANVVGEAALEAELARAGWQIIQPEALTFDQQFNLLSEASHIAGIEGSAFHTLMFQHNPEARVIVIRRKHENCNFDTIAAAKDIQQISLSDEISKLPGSDSTAYILDDPQRVAERILDYTQ